MVAAGGGGGAEWGVVLTWEGLSLRDDDNILELEGMAAGRSERSAYY